MFEPMINHVKLQVDTAVSHYVGRIAIALPLVVAAGFAVAAGYLFLETRFTPIEACAILAGIFVVISFIIAMLVVIQERNQRVLLRQSAQQSAVVASLMTAAPIALAGGGQLVRMIGLKAPLLIGAALLGFAMLSRSSDTEAAS